MLMILNGDRTFHNKAKALRPNQPSKQTTFWVGVLNDGQKAEDAEVESDFLWLKCHKGVTVQTIRQQYMSRNFQEEEIILKFGSRLLANPTTMRELNDHGDNLIAIEAVKPSDLATRMPRQPLQPSNAQVPAKSASPLIAPIKPSLEAGKRYTSPYSPRVSPLVTLNTPGSVTSGTSSGQRRTPFAYDENPDRYAIASPPGEPFVKSEAESEGLRAGLRLSPVATWNQGTPATVTQPGEIPTRDTPISDPARSASVELGDPAFATYVNKHRENLRVSVPSMSYDQIDTILKNRWLSAPRKVQTTYQAIAKADASAEEQKMEKSSHNFDFEETSTGNAGFESSEKPDSAQSQNFQLQTLLAGASPEILEESVGKGLELLENLKTPMLEKAPHAPDAAQWLQQIENVQKQAVKTKTVVGVVGNTGAGKSSVINAMLDEERLVPTNCMRACTAVVTEISYNYSDDPYRAEIDFITTKDWEKELKTLFEDLLDGNGNVSRDCSNEDTEAGVAYAKIRAVYPRKTKEDIANTSIDALIHHRDVVDLLGSSKTIKESDPLQFYRRLQHFVDSKEKSTGEKDKDKKKVRTMEYWPLIRVVRIYVKSPALSTGAVIVDLPGVHDSNAARAAVAEGYMKQCTGLWIVAPINRAVDDKAAKSLLGESFKRQLKMDGGFSSVTFICSKTDDISLMEAQDSLGLDEEMGALWEKRNSYENELKRLKTEFTELKDLKTTFGEAMEVADEQLELWDAKQKELENGEKVFAPAAGSTSNKKRKHGSGKSSRSTKRQRRSSGSESDDDQGSEDESDAYSEHDEEQGVDEEAGDPLTEEQINLKIAELKSTKKEGRRQRIQLEERIKVLRREMDDMKNADQKIEAQMSAMCISGRNAYSKGAIQQDFAAGIKELDQELAVEEDEEHFDPSVETRDYDEVARSLPVFCVSSRGYQKLQGRLRKDPAVPGFKTIEETEIPQLQTHCRQLTEKGRTASCKRFLNNLSQLLNSLSLWASSDGTGRNLTEDQKAKEARILQGSLKKLDSGLENVVETACKELKEEFGDNISDKFETATTNATNEASGTASKWGAPVNRDDRPAGGYHWSTYKAICRRSGVYSNAQGPHDWNVALAEPMMKVLAPGWEKTFSRRSPAVMASFARNASSLLKDFHHEMDARARQTGAGIAGLHMLQQQLRVYEEMFKDLSNEVKESINTQQKEINREFVPVITAVMEPAYTACVQECGPGSFMRMKNAMTSIVDQKRITMFRQSTQDVRTRLTKMMTAMEETMKNKADEVFMMMHRDYLAVLGGPDLPKGELMPKWQRMMREEVMKIVDASERIFKRIAGIDDSDEEEVDVGGLREESGDQVVKHEPDKETYEEDDEPLFRFGTPASDNGMTSDHPGQVQGDDGKMQEPDSHQRNEDTVMPDGNDQATVQAPVEQGTSESTINKFNHLTEADTPTSRPQGVTSKDPDNPSTTGEEAANNSHEHHLPLAKELDGVSENNNDGDNKTSSEDRRPDERSGLYMASSEDEQGSASDPSSNEHTDASDHITSSPANELSEKQEDGTSTAGGYEKSGAGDGDVGVVEEKMDEGE
ncbi:MAG: hypothetical protein M1830_008232 [Pleopsidium flavum]|nr:MAG: hypothetical protein M1830_008232 [Pleopsidium flavum]